MAGYFNTNFGALGKQAMDVYDGYQRRKNTSKLKDFLGELQKPRFEEEQNPAYRPAQEPEMGPLPQGQEQIPFMLNHRPQTVQVEKPGDLLTEENIIKATLYGAEHPLTDEGEGFLTKLNKLFMDKQDREALAERFSMGLNAKASAAEANRDFKISEREAGENFKTGAREDEQNHQVKLKELENKAKAEREQMKAAAALRRSAVAKAARAKGPTITSPRQAEMHINQLQEELRNHSGSEPSPDNYEAGNHISETQFRQIHKSWTDTRDELQEAIREMNQRKMDLEYMAGEEPRQPRPAAAGPKASGRFEIRSIRPMGN